MAVFINLPYVLKRLGERDREVCQMVAYTLEELHEFAKLLGLSKKDFEDCSVPHYLVPKELREVAFGLGAKFTREDLRQITTLRKRQEAQSKIQKEIKKRGRKKKNVKV